MKINKPVAILIGLFVILAVPVLAAVIIHTFSVDITVNEALSSTQVDVSVNKFPAETETISIPVTNAASVPIDVDFTWTEINNLNGVIYTTNMPLPVTLPASTTTNVDVTFTIDNGSPIGTFDGKVNIVRT